MLAEPQNNLDFRRELPDDGVKAAPGMDELRASGDDSVTTTVYPRRGSPRRRRPAPAIGSLAHTTLAR